MRRTFEIISTSFKLALLELWKNKLRTFLSLFGVTIGIFCIIGVLATVNSLEQNIQNQIKSLGTNTIYVDKWDYGGGGPDYPWWKYQKRPSPKYDEVQAIKQRTSNAKYVAFKIGTQDNVEYADISLQSVNLYGITQQFNEIQPIQVADGRYISDAEFEQGINVLVMGHDVAEKIFGNAERAVGKIATIRGKKFQIIGVTKKEGSSAINIGGWQFDQSVIMPYRYARNIMDERRADPLIMVQGQDNITSKALVDDLKGSMRAIHTLSPTQEDDFALNDINDFSDAMSEAFGSVNVGGWAIAILSLIVGMFGVANIMFVTVRERTSQIGLKKAVGAKPRVILIEFLLESAFLCIIGGLIGILLVFIMTKIITIVFDFPIFISTYYMMMAVVICIVVGVVAGIIPAYKASRLDPVVAIRS
jgi:ABC-type antimicrobial peptide transport system, permease component